MTDGCGAAAVAGPTDNDTVLLTPSIAEYMFVTRSAERLRSDYVANALVVRGTPLGQRFPGLNNDKILNGRVPNTSEAEWLLRTMPRFVFDWPFRVGYFANLGLPMLCLQQGARLSTWNSNAHTIEASANLTGRADQLAAFYASRLEAVAARTRSLSSSPGVAFIGVSPEWQMRPVNSESSDPGAATAAGVTDVTPRLREDPRSIRSNSSRPIPT
ncbi:MAG: hypothetical protein QM736_07590 [Vicinamibacterales bacterium]